MEALAAGQIVVLPFPFSDLSRSKYRPALLLADAGRGDWIACQVTSNPYADPRAIEILDTDFLVGGLQRTSYARPGKLFTASEGLFASAPAQVKPDKLMEARDAVVALVQEGGTSQTG